MSGLASLPDTIAGGDAETPDVYIGSEHLFNYGKWFSGVSAGPGIRLYASLGPSMKTDRLVLEGLLAGLPFTLQLGLQALLLALVIGVPAGMFAAPTVGTTWASASRSRSTIPPSERAAGHES
ncbi:MAG: hypothetical protein ABEN55_06095, partial [Bradymonadaceae bacterium]